MSRDNAPKARQLARRAQREARRASYSRVLIVSEGLKTEPHYFCEIRALYRLHSANVEVQPSQLGTAPLQVVNYAQQLFERGDSHKGIRPRAFDQVCVVFDRDEHLSYFDALHRAAALSSALRGRAAPHSSRRGHTEAPPTHPKLCQRRDRYLCQNESPDSRCHATSRVPVETLHTIRCAGALHRRGPARRSACHFTHLTDGATA